jgi:hypothetical protein
MDRLKLGLIFGGSGEEHPVSVKSAQHARSRFSDRHSYRSLSGIERRSDLAAWLTDALRDIRTGDASRF